MLHIFTMKQAESMTALRIMHWELLTDDKWLCTGQMEQNMFELICILVIQNWFVAEPVWCRETCQEDGSGWI